MHLPLLPRDDPVVCDPNTRTVWSILWSCTATIFACTWVSVHPNVPGPKLIAHGWFVRGMQRLKLMLLAIFCPEAMIIWAFRQWFVARSAKHYHLSMTHGFFFSMGGFIDMKGCIAEWKDLQIIAPAVSDFKKEELLDRSKGDALSKLISLLQTTWFMAYYAARAIQSLPITQLESATLAFTILNFGNYILWWHKPMNVEVPVLLKGFDFSRSQFGDSLVETPSYNSEQWDAADEMAVIATINQTTTNETESSQCTRETLCFQVMLTALCAMAKHVDIHYGAFIGAIIIGPMDVSHMLWDGCARRFGNLGPYKRLYIFYFGALVGAIFGGIHCIPWNSDFGSYTEHLLWRISVVTTVCVPLFLATHTHAMANFYIHMTPSFGLLGHILTQLYICARVFLLVDIFLSLRSLPPAAFEDVDWTKYIPHL
ncbi:uncharacterized protein EV420DRAFT_235105 [Desarmillaria tabescens]|uniref:Uncharacterized protein n=1 Tax=Armillaria tabescens TaxID=1929756 RepID=A0AA39J5R6_ARMTA|nr:uncharacterized protein EV420DRAFT_235105 [Desarmillaria tabescens]KAK0436660.1 hypothetical protein EV420DRAFT_235105 [Desarmillaria tabescens]